MARPMVVGGGGYRYYAFPGVWRDAFLYEFSAVARTPSDNFVAYRRGDVP